MFITFRRKYLPSINTLTLFQGSDIEPVLEKYEPLLPCTESLKHDKMETVCL